MCYLFVATGQPVVGLFPISARLAQQRQNSVAMFCLWRHFLLFSEVKMKWKWHRQIRQKTCQRQRMELSHKFAKAGRSWISQPTAPLWERRCSLCSLGSSGWALKEAVLGMGTRALGSRLLLLQGSLHQGLNSIKECSQIMRGLQSWKLHGCGARFMR